MHAPKPVTFATGSGRTIATYRRLLRVGFSPSQAEFLVGNTTYATAYERRYAFSRNQARTLATGTLTLAKLLKGGFTRHQAKVLLDVVA